MKSQKATRNITKLRNKNKRRSRR